MQNKSCTFCMHPFTGLATRSDGAVMACCRSHPVGNIQEQTLEEIWNNDTMKRIRKQVLNNDRPSECAPCFNLEDQGVESLRQRHIAGVIPEARVNLYPDALDALDEDYSMPFEIPTMEIKLNNLCNLKCRMCHPMDSTSWNDYKEVEEFYVKEGNFMVEEIRKLNLMKKPYLDKFDDNPNWWNSFEKLLPYFRRVEFAGGEPLMDPQHYRILDMLAPYGENIELKYATNGTTTGIKGGRTIHDYWPKFKSVAVNVSIDGIHDVYEYIRGNGKFSEVEENVKVFKSFPNVSRVVGAFTVQANNILQICDVIDYFLNDMGIIFYSHRVNYPMSLSAQVLPPELKKKVVSDLEDMKEKVLNYKLVQENDLLKKVTLQQIQDNINFLQSKCMYDTHWQDCIEFNKRLDKTRNQDFLSANPEFKFYV
jgi:MoaA/NifB/PqqE/SkfB family radical SAM enzyme